MMSPTADRFSKKMALISCLLLIANVVFSQSHKQLLQIHPRWKLGDQKTVHTESYSTIYIKDSVINHTEATADYAFKIIDTVKNYTLLYSYEPNALDIQSKSSMQGIDSAINFFVSLIKKVEKETKTFKYEMLVSKTTGQALKVKNGDKYLQFVEQAASTIIDQIGKEKGKTASQIDSAKQKITGYFKLAQPKILSTIINEFNYMMQPYSYTFAYNSTVSQKMMVYSVNALGDLGDTEIPAVVSITSKQQGNHLKILTNTDYDKAAFLELLKKKDKHMSDITSADVFMSEKVETIFNTTNGWIVSHQSDVDCKMKEVKVVNRTMVRFE